MQKLLHECNVEAKNEHLKAIVFFSFPAIWIPSVRGMRNPNNITEIMGWATIYILMVVCTLFMHHRPTMMILLVINETYWGQDLNEHFIDDDVIGMEWISAD